MKKYNQFFHSLQRTAKYDICGFGNQVAGSAENTQPKNRYKIKLSISWHSIYFSFSATSVFGPQ